MAQACSGSDVDISSGGWYLLPILGWVCRGLACGFALRVEGSFLSFIIVCWFD